MALLWMDGFEGYGDSDNERVETIIGRRYTYGGLIELERLAASAGVSLDMLFRVRTTFDLEKQIERLTAAFDLQAEAVRLLEEAIERYGFTLEELPEHFRQEELNGMFVQLWQDYQLLIGANIDLETVLRRMAPAINEMVLAAAAAGISIPESFRPLIQQLIDMGLLVDEFGVQIESMDDLDITFVDDLETVLRDAVSAIYALVDAIRALMGLDPLYADVDVTIGTYSHTHEKDETPPIGAQHGFSGWVMNPTTFKVAENAPEFVSVTPEAKMPSALSGGEPDVFHFHITLPGDQVLHFVEQATKQNRIRIHPTSVRSF